MLEIIITALVAFPTGVLVGFLIQRSGKKTIEPPMVYHARGGVHRPALKFGFVLDGQLTGEEIPHGVDPALAARERSEKEGQPYGARRI